MITPDLITRSNRRTLSLSVLKDGQVIVKAPTKMSQEAIDRFIYEKQHWIREKLAVIHQNQAKFDDIIHMKKYLLYGNQYDVKIANIKKIQTSTQDMCIYIPTSIEPDKIFSKLKNWYKKTAKTILEERLNYISSIIKLKPNQFKISDSKGRWGACNSKGTVNLNYRVIMLPPQIIDYVIVHELCHLVEMNHSKRFWNLVSSFMPNMESQKHAIKEYSFLLSLYGKQ
ncbi:MAG: M48 family metallopeptidase [Clostridia bacterium]|nr:M48 family metallopeptidase [Clostridia bacterium]